MVNGTLVGVPASGTFMKKGRVWYHWQSLVASRAAFDKAERRENGGRHESKEGATWL
jgi:hypothetical protein